MDDKSDEEQIPEVKKVLFPMSPVPTKRMKSTVNKGSKQSPLRTLWKKNNNVSNIDKVPLSPLVVDSTYKENNLPIIVTDEHIVYLELDHDVNPTPQKLTFGRILRQKQE